MARLIGDLGNATPVAASSDFSRSDSEADRDGVIVTGGSTAAGAGSAVTGSVGAGSAVTGGSTATGAGAGNVAGSSPLTSPLPVDGRDLRGGGSGGVLGVAGGDDGGRGS